MRGCICAYVAPPRARLEHAGGIGTGAHALALGSGFDGGVESRASSSLVLEDGRVVRVTGPASDVEDALTARETFLALVNGGLRVHVPPTDKARIVIGVLTEVRTARVVAEAKKQVGGKTDVAIGGPAGNRAAGALSEVATGNLAVGVRTAADDAIVQENYGVIGVRLLCFVLKFEPGSVMVSGGFPVVHGQEPVLERGMRWVSGGLGKLLRVGRRGNGFKALLVVKASDPGLSADEKAYVERAKRLEMSASEDLPSGEFKGLAGSTMWNKHDANLEPPVLHILHEVDEAFDDALDNDLRFKKVDLPQS